ncbi:hypothetical protein [Dyella silvatica]|uniref:hypothetical protein n=1 Tax=Dyella silvatica TaxID=2992128 RepID=UPI002257BCFD|nr:hypothetical protein [Dyella silvatica]
MIQNGTAAVSNATRPDAMRSEAIIDSALPPTNDEQQAARDREIEPSLAWREPAAARATTRAESRRRTPCARRWSKTP